MCRKTLMLPGTLCTSIACSHSVCRTRGLWARLRTTRTESASGIETRACLWRQRAIRIGGPQAVERATVHSGLPRARVVLSNVSMLRIGSGGPAMRLTSISFIEAYDNARLWDSLEAPSKRSKFRTELKVRLFRSPREQMVRHTVGQANRNASSRARLL